MSRAELWIARLLIGLVGRCAALLPLREEILFASPRARQPGAHLRALMTAFARQRPDLGQRLLAEPYGYSWRAKLGYLLRLLRGAYLLQRARITIIDNAWLPVHLLPRRRGTIVVQAWHAEGAYKRFGRAARGANRDGALGPLLHRGYSLALVSAEAARAPFAAAFGMPLEAVRAVGPLRGAALGDQIEVATAQTGLRERYRVPDGCRVILYAPTLRGRGAERRLGSGMDLRALRAALPGGWWLAAKAPEQRDDLAGLAGVDLLLPATAEITELFPLADLLLTDYSSIVYLWAILERPLLLDGSDLARYQQEPGFFGDPHAMIGEWVATPEEVARGVETARVDPTRWQAFAKEWLGASNTRATASELAVREIEAALERARLDEAGAHRGVQIG